LAAAIVALNDGALRERLKQFRDAQTRAVLDVQLDER